MMKRDEIQSRLIKIIGTNLAKFYKDLELNKTNQQINLLTYTTTVLISDVIIDEWEKYLPSEEEIVKIIEDTQNIPVHNVLDGMMAMDFMKKKIAKAIVKRIGGLSDK